MQFPFEQMSFPPFLPPLSNLQIMLLSFLSFLVLQELYALLPLPVLVILQPLHWVFTRHGFELKWLSDIGLRTSNRSHGLLPSDTYTFSNWDVRHL